MTMDQGSTHKMYYDSVTKRNRVLSEVQDLIRYRDLVKNLVRRNVTARYKRSVLGVLWTLLDPFFTMIIMAVVFNALLAKTIAGYPIFIFAGVIIWNFFSQSSTQAMVDFVYSGSLIVKVYMPKSVFAISAVGTGFDPFDKFRIIGEEILNSTFRIMHSGSNGTTGWK